MERASEQQKVVTSSVPVATVKPHSVNCKPRKSREHRSRSQEWPDVPDVGKIEEQNPELLAQKILETGRQIEAGKLAKPNVIVNGFARELEPRAKPPVHRAPPQPPPRAPPPLAHRLSPAKPQKPLNVVGKVQESPKVINFEDRLKSIITSVLNEDQEQRKAARQPAPSHAYANGYVRPAAGAFPPRGAATPTPPAPPAPAYVRAAVAAAAPRDFRRERYQFERHREPPRLPAHPAHLDPRAADLRQLHPAQPDYTQVCTSSFLIYPLLSFDWPTG